MDRHMIAYLLIAAMVAALAGLIGYARYNRRDRRMHRANARHNASHVEALAEKRRMREAGTETPLR